MGNLWYSDPYCGFSVCEFHPQLMIISISACMAGAVCGDHCSPISDTTIMASAGAQCDHVNHVSTQLPYAITAAAVSFISYIIAGFVQTAWIALLIAILLMLIVLVVIKMINKPLPEGVGNNSRCTEFYQDSVHLFCCKNVRTGDKHLLFIV